MDIDFSKMKPLKPADPTQAMVFLPNGTKLIDTGQTTGDTDEFRKLRIFEDEHGRKFCRLTNDSEISYGKRMPHQQALVSMLMKGIIPLTDIIVEAREGSDAASKYTVQSRPHYYSYMMPVDQIAECTDLENEQRAETIILSLIFNDNDHNPSRVMGYSSIQAKNIQEGANRYYFFDMGEARVFERNYNRFDVQKILTETYKTNIAVRGHIKGKLEQVIASYEGAEGLKTISAQVQYIAEKGENEFALAQIGTPEQIQRRLLITTRSFLNGM
jgi:hypothetical protein